ncbi:MAG: 4-hydroxythreonine-4-phosphate dehydrogenase PdxA [Ignavibacteriae bacterium]|nr:4-hydroxythreonine-4-phosphate dehydrogenase PdxA [Ignavibacteriota bacterium]
MAKPTIGITLGDLNGIGPEITLKSILAPSIRRVCSPILVGSIDVYEFYARRLRLRLDLMEIEFIPSKTTGTAVPIINMFPHRVPKMAPGKLTEEAGHFAGEAITCAAKLCKRGKLDGMVTAPVSKEAMALAGYRYPGQTEMLAAISGSRNVAMMLVANTFRIGLATVHVPIKRVSSTLSIGGLVKKISSIHHSLRHDFAVRSPRIALLGLNPHAGENGMIGSEEKEMMIPAMKRVRRNGIHIEGPFPADGFFGRNTHRQYDAVVAMYHDQGLIPLKMVGFSLGVNYSAGLRIVRTSPDHGTAFDIAGEGVADPRSMMEAIKLASRIISIRRTRRR